MQCMYLRQIDICKLLGISRPTAKKYIDIVRAHPDRYGQYAVCGRLIYIPAVIDAMTYCDAISVGLINRIPAYDAEAAAQTISQNK